MIDTDRVPPHDDRADTARCGEPELIGEILPRVLADLDARRRTLTPDQLAPIIADTDDDRREREAVRP
jgi:hypothetical protein